MKKHIQDFNKFSINEEADDSVYDLLIDAFSDFNDDDLQMCSTAFDEERLFAKIQEMKITLIERMMDKMENEISSGMFNTTKDVDNIEEMIKEIARKRIEKSIRTTKRVERSKKAFGM